MNKSSFLRVFRELVERMFATYRGQDLSYINRGYYYIWWLISNYKLYKGGSKSRCSLLSLMQIRKTTPREEHIFPVSFFLFHLRLSHTPLPNALKASVGNLHNKHIKKSAKCHVGYCLRFIFLVQCKAWEMPGGGD